MNHEHIVYIESYFRIVIFSVACFTTWYTLDRPLLGESLVIVIFSMIFLMYYAVIIM